jgi:hypothetical protein
MPAYPCQSPCTISQRRGYLGGVATAEQAAPTTRPFIELHVAKERIIDGVLASRKRTPDAPKPRMPTRLAVGCWTVVLPKGRLRLETVRQGRLSLSGSTRRTAKSSMWLAYQQGHEDRTGMADLVAG